MQQKSDKEIRQAWAESKRLAAVCLNTESTLPDRSEIIQVASALLAAGLVSVGKPVRAVNRAGADTDQDQMLGNAFGDRN